MTNIQIKKFLYAMYLKGPFIKALYKELDYKNIREIYNIWQNERLVNVGDHYTIQELKESLKSWINKP